VPGGGRGGNDRSTTTVGFEVGEAERRVKQHHQLN